MSTTAAFFLGVLSVIIVEVLVIVGAIIGHRVATTTKG